MDALVLELAWRPHLFQRHGLTPEHSLAQLGRFYDAGFDVFPTPATHSISGLCKVALWG